MIYTRCVLINAHHPIDRQCGVKFNPFFALLQFSDSSYLGLPTEWGRWLHLSLPPCRTKGAQTKEAGRLVQEDARQGKVRQCGLRVQGKYCMPCMCVCVPMNICSRTVHAYSMNAYACIYMYMYLPINSPVSDVDLYMYLHAFTCTCIWLCTFTGFV